MSRLCGSAPSAGFCTSTGGARVARLGQPKLLIVAPMSGHHATLLRGTVEAFLPTHDVYITDWVDARLVPMSQGSFDLDSYIDYVIAMLRELSPNLHVLAVCQSAVPVIAAVALLEADQDPCVPLSMTLIGGPIDTRGRPPASTSSRRSAAPTGSAATASSRCRSRSRASGGTSIRDSCSSPASWR